MLFFSLLAGGHRIDVQGNKRIEKEAIKSYIPDSVFSDSDALNEALKRLYETGYFKDVKLNLKKDVLVVEVIEQPIINKVAFEGNQHLSSDNLKEHVIISTGQAFSEFKIVDEAVQKIEAMYRATGYMNTKVFVQTRPIGEGRVDVVFKIAEGTRAFINEIKFIGNKAFSDAELRQKIESKVYSGFKFWSNSHYFSSEKLQQDYMKLQDFYHNNGYPDATVTSLSSELKSNQSGFSLVFSIKEGNKYYFGDMKLHSEHPKKIDLVALKKTLPIHQGETFNKSMLQTTEEWLNDELNRDHISTADVVVEPKKNGKYIDLHITIKKGSMNKIRFIHVKGNSKTYGRVIRNNLDIAEGNALNRYKLKQSEYSLASLGFFSKVNMVPREVGPHLYDIDLTVEDSAKTSSMAFNLGFGGDIGAHLQFQFTQRNIGGTGNDAQGAIVLADKSQEIQFSLMNPYFLNLPDVTGSMSFNFNNNVESFDRAVLQTGFSFGIGYNLGLYLYQRFEYSLGLDYIRLKDGSWHTRAIRDIFYKKSKQEADLSHLRWGNNNSINEYFGLGIPDGGFTLYKLKGWERELGKVPPKAESDPYKFVRDNKGDAAVIVNQYDSKSQKTKDLKKMSNQYIRDAGLDGETKNHRKINADGPLTDDDILCLRTHLQRQDDKIKLLENDLGVKVNSNISHTLVFRPFKYNPNRHFSFDITMNNTLAGIGGNVRYFKNSVSLKYLWRLPVLNMLLKTTASAGRVDPLGQTLRLQDCVALSNAMVKGFDYVASIAPRDKKTGTALNGKKYYHGGVELKLPIFDPQSYGVNVGVYANFGNVWDSEFKNKPGEEKTGRYQNGDWDKVRFSVGGFMSLRLPVFPIRLDYAIILNKESYDREERFSIGVDM